MASLTRVVHGKSINSQMSISASTSRENLSRMFGEVETRWPADPPVSHIEWGDSAGDYLTLSNMSELVYKLPQFTTLVEVLGPTRVPTGGQGACYATLNPRPTWIQGFLPAINSTWKRQKLGDQTMFLLPMGPKVDYTLHVGGVSHSSSCAISAIRTYPYHLWV